MESFCAPKGGGCCYRCLPIFSNPPAHSLTKPLLSGRQELELPIHWFRCFPNNAVLFYRLILFIINYYGILCHELLLGSPLSPVPPTPPHPTHLPKAPVLGTQELELVTLTEVNGTSTLTNLTAHRFAHPPDRWVHLCKCDVHLPSEPKTEFINKGIQIIGPVRVNFASCRLEGGMGFD